MQGGGEMKNRRNAGKKDVKKNVPTHRGNR